MFLEKTPDNDFTKDEIEEIGLLLSKPENALLQRFINALWDDRKLLITEYLEVNRRR